MAESWARLSVENAVENLALHAFREGLEICVRGGVAELRGVGHAKSISGRAAGSPAEDHRPRYAGLTPGPDTRDI